MLLTGYSGKIDNHIPGDRLVQFLNVTPFIFLKQTCLQPLPGAMVIFIDGSSNGRASYVLNNQVYPIDTPYRSAPLVELFAAFTVFSLFSQVEFNLFSDSHYVLRALQILEMVPTIQPITPTFQLFFRIQKLLRARAHPFFIGHIHAHSGLPDPLSQGSELADRGT